MLTGCPLSLNSCCPRLPAVPQSSCPSLPLDAKRSCISSRFLSVSIVFLGWWRADEYCLTALKAFLFRFNKGWRLAVCYVCMMSVCVCVCLGGFVYVYVYMSVCVMSVSGVALCVSVCVCQPWSSKSISTEAFSVFSFRPFFSLAFFLFLFSCSLSLFLSLALLDAPENNKERKHHYYC